MITQRYELAIERIKEMTTEETVGERFLPFFRAVVSFLLYVESIKKELESGVYQTLSEEELQIRNKKLYEEILPENYESSYTNPAYAAVKLGEEYGQILSFLYAEMRGVIPYTFEHKEEYLTILYELFIEIYNCFEGKECPEVKELKDIIYWFACDYCDIFVADRIQEQIDPDQSFAVDMILNSNLEDLTYLYRFGEYIGENERETARYLNQLPEETIEKMAEVYTEGYRMGFVNTGKDLSKKKVVNIRYVLGFERVVKSAIEKFQAMGLRPVIYRAASSVLTKKQHIKIGYYGGIANKQYEYDHRHDQGLFLNKRFVERKLEVLRHVYEMHKELAAGFAGPAVMEVFGEEPFSPAPKQEAVALTKKQEELSRMYDSKAGQITNTYIKGEERSFTIIAYPVPEIGPDYQDIFQDTIALNTLDAKLYETIQQKMIDVLDKGKCVHIKGKDGNRTDLTVCLQKVKDPEKETVFENCVADVNIPVGEVFTSPVLEGTNGILHVKKVYLNELQYEDLSIQFANGMIADYTCSNFQRESDCKKYIQENVLYNHPTLAMGEFAIGTNTTAYVMARKYGIEDKMPILIAEKTGPHFAVGDTCYSWSEDIAVYNPNGKEIIARDNSVSILRKEDVGKAYYHCHTDITIPYEELGEISVEMENEEKVTILLDGRFVLPGTEILNEPLNNETEL